MKLGTIIATVAADLALVATFAGLYAVSLMPAQAASEPTRRIVDVAPIAVETDADLADHLGVVTLPETVIVAVRTSAAKVRHLTGVDGCSFGARSMAQGPLGATVRGFCGSSF